MSGGRSGGPDITYTTMSEALANNPGLINSPAVVQGAYEEILKSLKDNRDGILALSVIMNALAAPEDRGMNLKTFKQSIQQATHKQAFFALPKLDDNLPKLDDKKRRNFSDGAGHHYSIN